MDNEKLIHYGVLGMKWGVRRASRDMQNTHSDLFGDVYASPKTAKKIKNLDRALSVPKPSNRKIYKAYRRYDNAAKKDYRRTKHKDVKMANNISSGRLFAKLMMNTGLRNATVKSVARRSNVKPYSDFVYNLIRNDEVGGVSITVGDNTEVYRYGSKPKKLKSNK